MAADPRLEIARRLIGSPRDAPPTPALILDLALVEKNIAEMKRRMDPLPASLRPHAKIRQEPDAGPDAARGRGGRPHDGHGLGGQRDDRPRPPPLLIANQAVGHHKAAELARLGGLAEVIVAVESTANAEELSAAARDAGTEVGVLVEFDVGLHRSGVRTVPEAVGLGGLVEKLPGCACAASSATRVTACSSPTGPSGSRSARRRTTP